MTAPLDKPPLGYGLIGAGGFGRFALDQYLSLDGLEVRAIADVDADLARRAATEVGVQPLSVEQLLDREDIDLVHIATPPFTHRDLVGRALEANKHVLCEKPLATRLDEAGRLLDMARERGKVLAVDLMLRYDPLCEAVRSIVREQLLGPPLHGFFENYAKDEPLPPGHWFWDPDKSGGIFIEHGVHFFDLFQWWLGEGTVLAAQQVRRPGTDLIEQVQATLRYESAEESGPLVNFHHGFTQASRMDRQEIRLVFEQGVLRLHEWVPTSLEVDAIVTRETLDRLEQILPDGHVRTRATYEGEDRRVTSRHRTYLVDGHYHLTSGTGMSKDELYGHALRGLMVDQLTAMRGVAPPARRVAEANGYTSLSPAVTATRLARSNPS